MNYNTFKTSNTIFRTLVILLALASPLLFSSCSDDDDPKKEDTPELITKVTLTFTPTDGGDAIVVSATDPDGEGVNSIAADGPVSLSADKSYTLTLQLLNELVKEGEEGYDITAEVEEESDEHMFFFSWTNDVFSDPAGNGNVDNRNDVINYNDKDANNLPVGLSTDWTSATGTPSGNFRVLLKHQPKLKNATSTSSTGETDLDVTFTLNVQ